MVFHNDDTYPPMPTTADNHILGYRQGPPIIEQDGLYFRGDIEFSKYRSRLEGSDGSIDDYQQWVDAGWKEEYGTTGAAERFIDKLREEYGEFSDAVVAHQEDPTEPATTEVCLEAGDVLWCATALASLSRAVLDEELKDLLYKYNHGVAHHDHRGRRPPKWQPTAGQLAIKRSPLLIRDISMLIADGFEPLMTPQMNVEEGEDDGDIAEHLDHMLFLATVAINRASGLFALDEEDPIMLMPGAVDEKGHLVGVCVANLYLEVAFILDRTTAGTFEEAIQRNVQKLTGRVAEGKVDKSDGER